MTDLISRADAIRIVDSYIGTDHILDRIKALPSADAYFTDGNKIGEWIPCSERLPNDTKDVLVCMRNGWIYIASYRHSRRLWKFDADGYADCEIVRAWMPLPKPYREDGE